MVRHQLTGVLRLLAALAVVGWTVYGVVGKTPISVIADGDSITHGNGVTASQAYCVVAANSYPYGYGLTTNLGVSGETFATMLANQSTAVLPLITSAHAAKQLAISSCFAGTNDIKTSGLDAATVFGTATSYFAGLVDAGSDWNVCWTMLPRTGEAGTFETERLNFNALMRASYASIGCSVLADVGADPSLGNVASPGNATLYQNDFIHPTVLGQTILADYFAAAVLQVRTALTVSAVTVGTASISGSNVIVTITGTGFSRGVEIVSIGGIRAQSFTVANDTTITALTSPAYYTGTGAVMVIGYGGSAILPSAWTWTP
jgi:hypothetical protein